MESGSNKSVSLIILDDDGTSRRVNSMGQAKAERLARKFPNQYKYDEPGGTITMTLGVKTVQA